MMSTHRSIVTATCAARRLLHGAGLLTRLPFDARCIRPTIRGGVVLLGLMTLCFAGCASSNPLDEVGVYAYEGNAVRTSGDIPVLNLGGGREMNRINLDRDEHERKTSNRELISLYVRPAEVDNIEREDEVFFDRERLAEELTKQARHTAAGWGPFFEVDGEDEAELIATVRLESVTPWGDTTQSLKEFVERSSGEEIAQQAIEEIEREGMDLSVALEIDLNLPDRRGTIASTTVLGRAVSARGELYTTSSMRQGRIDGFEGGHTAKIDDSRIPAVLNEATGAAFITVFDQLDGMVWAPPDESGRCRAELQRVVGSLQR